MVVFPRAKIVRRLRSYAAESSATWTLARHTAGSVSSYVVITDDPGGDAESAGNILWNVLGNTWLFQIRKKHLQTSHHTLRPQTILIVCKPQRPLRVLSLVVVSGINRRQES